MTHSRRGPGPPCYSNPHHLLLLPHPAILHQSMAQGNTQSFSLAMLLHLTLHLKGANLKISSQASAYVIFLFILHRFMLLL